MSALELISICECGVIEEGCTAAFRKTKYPEPEAETVKTAVEEEKEDQTEEADDDCEEVQRDEAMVCYKIMDEGSMRRIRESLVSRLCEITAIKPAHARTVLRFKGWDLESAITKVPAELAETAVSEE